MHLDIKKLSATRNVIFDLHDLLGGWDLAQPLFNGKTQIQHSCFALPWPGLRALAGPVGSGWVDGWIPALAFPCFLNKAGSLYNCRRMGDG